MGGNDTFIKETNGNCADRRLTVKINFLEVMQNSRKSNEVKI